MKKQAPAVDAEMKLDEIQNDEKGDSREELHMDGSNEKERPAAIEVAQTPGEPEEKQQAQESSNSRDNDKLVSPFVISTNQSQKNEKAEPEDEEAHATESAPKEGQETKETQEDQIDNQNSDEPKKLIDI